MAWHLVQKGLQGWVIEGRKAHRYRLAMGSRWHPPLHLNPCMLRFSAPSREHVSQQQAWKLVAWRTSGSWQRCLSGLPVLERREEVPCRHVQEGNSAVSFPRMVSRGAPP